MDKQRYKIEYAILERNFKNRFVFKEVGDKLILDLGLKSSEGHVYRLEVALPSDYPASIPQVIVTYPNELYTYRGEPLVDISPSHFMHTLNPVDGCVQLCHYKMENWHSNVTLYKIALKCLIWIEAYENHLKSGRPLTDYLGI
jgi:ubiquitin-protein ligase